VYAYAYIYKIPLAASWALPFSFVSQVLPVCAILVHTKAFKPGFCICWGGTEVIPTEVVEILHNYSLFLKEISLSLSHLLCAHSLYMLFQKCTHRLEEHDPSQIKHLKSSASSTVQSFTIIFLPIFAHMVSHLDFKSSLPSTASFNII
jgi:hypothetical protein